LKRQLVAAALAVVFIAASSVANAPPVRAATSPPGAPTGITVTAGTLSATVRWTPTGAAATSFTVVSKPGGISATVPGTATSATVTGLGFALAYNFTVTGTNFGGAGPASAASNFVTPIPPGGPFHAGPTAVLLNSDISAGQPLASNLGDDPVHLPGLSGVVLNVTASQATAPTGVQLVVNQQVVQTVWVAPGQVASSLAIVAAPPQLSQGAVQVGSGRAHVELDFVGFFTGPTTLRDHSGLLQLIHPATVFNAASALGSSTDIPILGQGDVPVAHVAAVLLNVSASNSGGNGSFAIQPSGGVPTNVTTLGFASGQTTVNRDLVAVGSNGAITVVDRGAAATGRIDVLGWFTDGTDATAIGALYSPLANTRLVDTSSNGGPLSPGGSLGFAVSGQGGAPSGTSTAPATSAVLEVTAVSPAGAGSIAVSGSTAVVFSSGSNASGVGVVQLASDGTASLTVSGASTNVTVDLVGYQSGDLIVPGTTKKLSAALLAGITSLTDSSITFGPGVAASPPIVMNDVINAGASLTTPNGFLRRVLTINQLTTGETVLTTRRATLSEALTAFSIDWILPKQPGAFGMRAGSRGAVSASLPPFQPPPGTSIDPAWPVLTLVDPNGPNLQFPVPIKNLSGSLTINDLELQVVPHFVIKGNPFTGVSFAAGLSLGARFEADVSLSGTVAGTRWTPIDDTLKGAIFVIPATPLDIIGRPVMEFKATVDLSLQASLTASFNLDKYGLVTAGYNNGFFGNFQGVDYIPNGKMVKLTPSLTVQVTPGLHVIPGVEFYGFETVGADVNPYFGLTVNPLANPWWTEAFGLCVHIVEKIELILLSGDWTLDLPCSEKQIAAAPGAKINITITPNAASVPRGGAQHFNAATDGSHGVLWSLAEGSTGGSLSNITVTDVDYTAPTRAGTYHLEVASVDDPTSTAEAVITVPATPPRPPLNVVASLINPSAAAVAWSTPTDDGGAPLIRYEVKVSPGGATVSAGTTTDSATVNNLAAGTTYAFTVTAVNAAFLASAPSAPSNSVTTPPPGVVTVSPASIDFGSFVLGQTSSPQTVTVQASGTSSLSISTLTLVGARTQDFAILSDQCSNRLIPVNGSCTFQVEYTANVQGTSTATLQITDDASSSPQTVGLMGGVPLPIAAGFHPAAVQFLDAKRGWVGDWGTTDGGATWIREPAGSFRYVDATHGWGLGSVRVGTSGCFADCVAILATTDGGQTSTRLAIIPFLQPTGLWFSDANHGWISGVTFVSDPSGIGNGRTQMYATTDGGHTWTLQSLPDPQFNVCTHAVDDRALEVAFADPSNGWAYGMSACIDHSTGTETNPLTLAWSTTDGGAHWTAHNTGLNTYHFVPDSRLHVESANQVGFTTQDFNGSGGPVLVTTTDGGVTWTKLTLPDLFAGDFQYIDARNLVLIGGANGAQSVYRSSDGGSTWTKTAPLPSQVNVVTPGFTNSTEIRLIQIVDSTHWWVTGAVDYVNSLGQSKTGGLIYMSSDGGLTWSLQLAGDGT